MSGPYRRRYRGYHPSRSIGHEKALAHIAAANRLTAELGGMDRIVKSYFFNLPPRELSAVLDEYEQKHGPSKRKYAERILPYWRSGKRRMGGENAGRLFDLLPPRMPLALKYQVVEGLWKHVGPSSKHRIRVGLHASLEQVVEAARAKIAEFVVHYKIPDEIERRFDWLSAGDVSIKQMLLGHIQEIEKSIVVEAIRAQVPVMLEHLRSARAHTGRLAQTVRVGKHELELLMDETIHGVQIEGDPIRSGQSVRPVEKKTFDPVIPLPVAVGMLVAAVLAMLIVGYEFSRPAASPYSRVPRTADTQARRTDVSSQAPKVADTQISRGDFSGPVRVIDGDTLDMNGIRIRLWGMDAPEMGQTCQGKDGNTYEWLASSLVVENWR